LASVRDPGIRSGGSTPKTALDPGEVAFAIADRDGQGAEATAGKGPTTSKDDSGTGTLYTEGDRYVDYGALYLDILRNAKEAVLSARADQKN